MPNDILNNFRTKYPQYKDVDDSTLAVGIVNKYPQYKDALADVLSPVKPNIQAPPFEAARSAAYKPIYEGLTSPGRMVEQAAQTIKRDVGAGIGQAGQAGLQAGMELTGLPTFIRSIKQVGPVGQFAGEGLEGVMNAPVQAFQGLSGLINQGLAKVGIPENVRNLGMSPEANQELSNLAINAGTTALAPQFLRGAGAIAEAAPKAIGAVAERVIPESLSPRLAGAAHKPPYNPAKGIQQFDRQIQTVTREDLPPTRQGIQKVTSILKGLDNISKPIRTNAAKAGVTVDFSENGFQKYLEDAKTEYKNDADFAEKSAALDEMKSRVARLAESYPNGQVPLDKAWQFKSSLQDMATGKYDQTAGYKIEAAKTAAHGVLDDIISKAPELREIGLRQRDLIEAQSMIARRVAAREGSKIVNVRNLKIAGAAATGGLIGGVPGGVIGAGADIVAESPYLQHKAAVALDRLRAIGKTPTSPYGNYTPKPFPSSGAAPSSPQAPTGATPPPSFTPPSGTGVPPFQESTISPRMDLNEKLPPEEPNWEGFSLPKGYRQGLERKLGADTVTKYGKVKDLSDQDLYRALVDTEKAPSAYLNEIHPKQLYELVKAGKISRAQAAQAMTERGKVHVDNYSKK